MQNARTRPARPRAARSALLLAWLGVLVLATAAAAHGPTVTIGPDGPEPVRLQMEPGQTVHFQNADGEPHRVRGAGDAFRSPELAPGEGWHLRLGFPGSFEYAVEGRPEWRGTLDVGAAEPGR